MKNQTLRKIIAIGAIASLSTGVLTGCGSSTKAAEKGEGVKEITVAVAGGFFPITYADDNGDAQGYDVEVLKKVDELLPQYSFKYEITDKETMNVGVQSGTYQIGINSLFKTEEREKTYYIPENNLGYTAVGLIHREGDDINSFDDVYDNNLKPYTVNAAGGIRFVYERWNEAHPDKTLSYELSTEFSYAELFAAIKAGDFDFTPDLIPVFNLQSEETVAGLTISEPVDVIPTYAIINKNETELGDAVNEALGKLASEGKLGEISNEVFGYDVFALAK